MLLANHGNRMENSSPQEDIIYLVTNAEMIAEAKLEFAFSDRHSILSTASFYDNLTNLKQIKWLIFFESPKIGGYSEIWQSRPDKPEWIDRKEVRQAEFLIYEKLPWAFIKGVATMNEEVATKVRDVLNKLNLNTPVVVKHEWYY